MKKFMSSSQKRKYFLGSLCGVLIVSGIAWSVINYYEAKRSSVLQELDEEIVLFEEEEVQKQRVYRAKANYLAGTKLTEEMFEVSYVDEVTAEKVPLDLIEADTLCLTKGIQKENILYEEDVAWAETWYQEDGRMIEYVLPEGCMPQLIDITNHYIDIVRLSKGELDQVVISKCLVLATNECRMLLNLSDEEIESLQEVEQDKLYLRIYIGEDQQPSEVTYIPMEGGLTWED